MPTSSCRYRYLIIAPSGASADEELYFPVHYGYLYFSSSCHAGCGFHEHFCGSFGYAYSSCYELASSSPLG